MVHDEPRCPRIRGDLFRACLAEPPRPRASLHEQTTCDNNFATGHRKCRSGVEGRSVAAGAHVASAGLHVNILSMLESTYPRGHFSPRPSANAEGSTRCPSVDTRSVHLNGSSAGALPRRSSGHEPRRPPPSHGRIRRSASSSSTTGTRGASRSGCSAHVDHPFRAPCSTSRTFVASMSGVIGF
jgi:hypothetical protein